MPKRRARSGPRGLVWRDGRAYFDRRHRRFVGGRLAISLRTSDPDLAAERHSVLVQLMGRGDWSVLESIRSGHMHISDAQAALRDGDQKKLRRMGAEAPRIGQAIERFLERKRATKTSSTVDQYAVRLGRYRDRVGADTPMDEIGAADARAYLQEGKPKKPWAPTTQEAVRVALAALWNMVMEEEAEALAIRNVHPSIRQNPWKGLEMPERRPTRAVFLTPEEWRDLDRAMVGYPYRAMVACAFLAGLRMSEIRYLRTGVDVLLSEEPVIRIQARKGEHPWRPKTRRGERDVPITPALVRILETHAERGFGGSRYLIRTPDTDRPISDGTALRWTREAYEAAGIRYGREGDSLTLHSGRHTYASWLAQDGVPLNVIAVLIGDTTKVVEDVYAHLIPDTFRAAVDNIERRASYNAFHKGES